MTGSASSPAVNDRIDGVVIHELTELTLPNGTLVEFFRPEWLVPNSARIDHVFRRVYAPGAVSAWHMHQKRTDYLFFSGGPITVVLFDARGGSRTRGRTAEYNLDGDAHLMIVPPGLWHGFHNKGPAQSIVIGMSDLAYDTDNPDEIRLPMDSPEIPYRFSR